MSCLYNLRPSSVTFSIYNPFVTANCTAMHLIRRIVKSWAHYEITRVLSRANEWTLKKDVSFRAYEAGAPLEAGGEESRESLVVKLFAE